MAARLLPASILSWVLNFDSKVQALMNKVLFLGQYREVESKSIKNVHSPARRESIL
jgi:hypothetical protein